MRSDLKPGDIIVCTKAWDAALPGDLFEFVGNVSPFGEYFGLGRFYEDSISKTRGW